MMMRETTNAVVLQTIEEGLVAPGVMVLEDRVADAVSTHGVPPEATRRVQASHVRDCDGEGGEEHRSGPRAFLRAWYYRRRK